MENYLKKLVILLVDSDDNKAKSAMGSFIETLKNLGYGYISTIEGIDRNSDLFDIFFIDFLEFAEGGLKSCIENLIFQSKGMAVEIVYFTYTDPVLAFIDDIQLDHVSIVNNDLTQLKVNVTERLGKENQGSLIDVSYHCFFISVTIDNSLLSKNLYSLSDYEVWQIWKDYELVRELALIADEIMFQNFIKRVYELRLKNL